MIFLGLIIVVGINFLAVLTANGSLEPYFDSRAFGILAVGITAHIAWFGPQFFLPGLKTVFRLPRAELGETDPKLGKYYRRLTGFTLGFATVVAFVGLLVMLVDLDPESIGKPLAISLLTLIYAIVIALTIFLPISLRHLPDSVEPKTFPIFFTLTGFADYFLTRALMVALFVALSTLPKEQTGVSFEQFSMEVRMILTRIFFYLNPVDMELFEGFSGYSLLAFWQTSGVVLVGILLWGFRVASGRIHNRWTWTPVCILYGLLGTLVGMVLMLSDLNTAYYSIGCMTALLTVFYGMLAAIFFTIGSWRLPVLLVLGGFIAVLLQALTMGFVQHYPLFFVFLGFWILLFLFILWGGIKKMRMARSTALQSPQPPLTPEEKQARRILDKAVEAETAKKRK